MKQAGNMGRKKKSAGVRALFNRNDCRVLTRNIPGWEHGEKEEVCRAGGASTGTECCAINKC
jgi:hypothetical protein